MPHRGAAGEVIPLGASEPLRTSVYSKRLNDFEVSRCPSYRRLGAMRIAAAADAGESSNDAGAAQIDGFSAAAWGHQFICRVGWMLLSANKNMLPLLALVLVLVFVLVPLDFKIFDLKSLGSKSTQIEDFNIQGPFKSTLLAASHRPNGHKNGPTKRLHNGLSERIRDGPPKRPHDGPSKRLLKYTTATQRAIQTATQRTDLTATRRPNGCATDRPNGYVNAQRTDQTATQRTFQQATGNGPTKRQHDGPSKRIHKRPRQRQMREAFYIQGPSKLKLLASRRPDRWRWMLKPAI